MAVLTNNTDRFVSFYKDIFDAEVFGQINRMPDGGTLTMVRIGELAEFNVFEVPGNTEADRQTPMLGRGRIDHLAIEAASLAAFEEIRRRLMACGAADDFVTDFGPILSLFFRDPDGLEAEVCVANPDYAPGATTNPPGTRALRYS